MDSVIVKLEERKLNATWIPERPENVQVIWNYCPSFERVKNKFFSITEYLEIEKEKKAKKEIIKHLKRKFKKYW